MGWTDPEGSRSHIGALLLGHYTEAGRLHYAGRAGTGVTEKELKRLAGVLVPLQVPKMPLAEPPPHTQSKTNLAASVGHRGLLPATERFADMARLLRGPRHLADKRLWALGTALGIADAAGPNVKVVLAPDHRTKIGSMRRRRRPRR